MIHPIFTGVVKNGKLILSDPDSFKKNLSRLENREVEITVKKRVQSRTNAENRYYWGVIVNMVAAEMGIVPDEAHDFLKGLFLKAGIEHDGKRYEITRGTSSLSINDFEDYCEKCRQWAANELNCPIPLPNEIEITI